MNFFHNTTMNLRRLLIRHPVAAVLDEDIPLLLAHFGLADALTAGMIACSSCHEPISSQTLAGWRKEGHSLLLFCDKSECLERVASPAEPESRDI
jgi:hypothetical protein